MMIHLAVALLTFALGVAIAFNKRLFELGPETNVSVSSDAGKRTSSVPEAYQSELVNIVHIPDEPVRIVDIRLTKTGELLIEIENISPQTITFVGYTIAPFDRCPKSDHPMAFWIGHGDWSVLSGEGSYKTGAPIAPGQKFTLADSRNAYEGILNSQKSAKCPAAAKPELQVRMVAFDDDSRWGGVGD